MLRTLRKQQIITSGKAAASPLKETTKNEWFKEFALTVNGKDEQEKVKSRELEEQKKQELLLHTAPRTYAAESIRLPNIPVRIKYDHDWQYTTFPNIVCKTPLAASVVSAPPEFLLKRQGNQAEY